MIPALSDSNHIHAILRPPNEFLGPDIHDAMLTRWMNNIGNISFNVVNKKVIYLKFVEERQTVEEKLIESKLEAEKAYHAKSAFLATMSHEIRFDFLDSVSLGTFLTLRTEIQPMESSVVQTYLHKQLLHKNKRNTLTLYTPQQNTYIR